MRGHGAKGSKKSDECGGDGRRRRGGGVENPDIEPRNLTAGLHYKCCKTRVSPKCRRRNEYHL